MLLGALCPRLYSAQDSNVGAFSFLSYLNNACDLTTGRGPEFVSLYTGSTFSPLNGLLLQPAYMYALALLLRD